MAWETWIIPAVLLGGVGGLYYLMAKKGIGCCGSMMSRGCGMDMQDKACESPQPKAEVREPVRKEGGSPQPPMAPAHTRQGALVGGENGHPQER